MVDLMEKKKLLLVSVSVGVFLVIAIGASILVFSPRGSSPAAVNTVSTVKPIPPGDGGQTGNSPVELLKTPDSGPRDNIVYVYGENPDDTVTVDRTTPADSNRLVVDVRRPTAAAVPEAPAPAPKPAPAPVVSIASASY